MQVKLKDNEYFNKDIYLIEQSKILNIMYGGTLDLYWTIYNKDFVDSGDYCYDTFEITKENYALYEIFDNLINDIKNGNIYHDKNIFSLDFDKDTYNKIYDSKNDIITWYSDEDPIKIANKVQIKKDKDKILILFTLGKDYEEYESKLNLPGVISIRFRNSGSRYSPFNILFMRMFTSLQNIDDIKDQNHQIHIEEYLYQRKRKKV